MFNIHLAGIPEEYTRKKFIKEIVQKQRRNLKPKDKFPDERAMEHCDDENSGALC